MRIWKLNILLLLAIFLIGCAGTTQFQNYPNLDTRNTPTAMIHVIRSNSAFGSAITAPVFIDRYRIGNIGPGGYLKTRVPVGRVSVTSTTADVIVQTEKGKQYFIEIDMPVQGWMYSPDFNASAVDRQRAIEVLGFDPSER